MNDFDHPCFILDQKCAEDFYEFCLIQTLPFGTESIYNKKFTFTNVHRNIFVYKYIFSSLHINFFRGISAMRIHYLMINFRFEVNYSIRT